MFHMKYFLKATAFAIVFFIAFTESVISSETTAENFSIYNLKGERSIFYKILNSLPDNGKVIVNFTSVYCQPCRKEIPQLVNINESKKGNIVLMCIFAETSDLVIPVAKTLDIKAKTYVDPFGNIQKMYNVKKYPVTLVIDKDYKILGRFEGFNESNMENIRKICYER